MTQEEKEQFIAQYWGQGVGYVPDNGQLDSGSFICTINEMAMDAVDYLLLTSLPMITDEHSIEIAKIWYCQTKRHTVYDGEALVMNINNNLLGLRNMSANDPFKYLKVIDYLRSKGYTLPWNGHTVEEMVEQGIIKLKIK